MSERCQRTVLTRGGLSQCTGTIIQIPSQVFDRMEIDDICNRCGGQHSLSPLLVSMKPEGFRKGELLSLD
jgi:hypothetical protein